MLIRLGPRTPPIIHQRLFGGASLASSIISNIHLIGGSSFAGPFVASWPAGVSWDTNTGKTVGYPTGITTTFANHAGTVRNIASPADWNTQMALASDGDIFNITADLTITSSLIVSKGILVRSSGFAGLPAYVSDPYAADSGDRIDPITHAASMRKIIVRANNTPAFRFDNGVTNVWFLGLNVYSDLGFTQQNALFDIAGRTSHTSEADFPKDITIDRCFAGSFNLATDNVRRAIRLDGLRIKLCHSVIRVAFDPAGSDSQALAMFSGGGVGLAFNCEIVGGTENILFGGSVVTVTNYDFHDWLFIRNLWKKDTSWSTRTIGKNWWEYKHGVRCAFIGNVCRNYYAGAQQYALLLNVANPTGANPWSKVEDVIFWGNKFYNINGGLFDFAPDGSNPNPNLGTRRVEYAHNWAPDNPTGAKKTLLLGNLDNPANDFAIYHSLFACTVTWIGWSNPTQYLPAKGFILADNINTKTLQFGPLFADGGMANKQLLDAIFDLSPGAQWICRNNWKQGTAWPADLVAAPHLNANFSSEVDIFEDLISYHVKTTHAAHNSCLDGTDPGPNYTMLDALTAGVE